MSVVKAITFDIRPASQPLHGLCLAHHQRDQPWSFFCLKIFQEACFSRKYGSNKTMSKALTSQYSKKETAEKETCSHVKKRCEQTLQMSATEDDLQGYEEPDLGTFEDSPFYPKDDCNDFDNIVRCLLCTQPP